MYRQELTTRAGSDLYCECSTMLRELARVKHTCLFVQVMRLANKLEYLPLISLIFVGKDSSFPVAPLGQAMTLIVNVKPC